MPDSCRPGIGRSRGIVAPPREHDGVELAPQLVGRNVGADVGVGPEPDALGLHDREPAIEDALLHLELGDAVAKQAADAIGALEHRDPVPGLVELIGGREPRRARADDRDALAGARRRRLRRDPALVEGALDDRVLDALDRDRVAVDAEHAGAFARRRAEPAGELGEVVRRAAAARSPPATDRGRRDRSSPGSGCPSGQPWWQNGMPQSMQRAPCCAQRLGRCTAGRPRASP